MHTSTNYSSRRPPIYRRIWKCYIFYGIQNWQLQIEYL